MQEEDFRARLDAELDELGPPIGALVAAATQDGVRQRRRRTIVQLTAGTAGVAAVVAGAAFTAGSFGRDSGGSGSAGLAPGAAAVAPATTSAVTPVAPTTPPAPATSSSSAPGPVTSTSGTLSTPYKSSEISGLPTVPPGQARTTAQAMALLLEQNITKTGGAGDFTHVTAYAPDGSPEQTQRTTFMSDLYWNHATIAVRVDLPPLKTDPKGGENVFRWDTPGVTGTSEVKLAKSERGVELTRADGSKVTVLEINGRELGDAGPDRPDLPFTSDQLLAIARDAHWGPTMSKEFVEQAASIQLDPHQ